MLQIWSKLTSFEFWLQIIETIKDYGPLVPTFLTFIESLFPALPLIMIVSFNVSVYGTWLGFIYSWIGTVSGSIVVFSLFRYIIKRYLMKFIQNNVKLKSLSNTISNKGYSLLFLLTSLPFTPSSFINIIYGLSDIDTNFFISTIVLSKFIMISYLVFFGYSLTQIINNPIWLFYSLISMIFLYLLSKRISKYHLNK